MGISIKRNKKSAEAKSILKVMSALSFLLFFEHGTLFNLVELEQINKCSEVLDNTYKRIT